MQRAINSAASPCVKVATKPLPVCLRQGMERISGVNLQRVRVHYNSHKPSQVQAQAYAQGEDIYLAPGQERHLPHELGHVVQQKMGMVEPTVEVNGVAVNDDPRLEQHATELGEMAVRVGAGELPA
ncbi:MULTISPECIES: eCIS core domain-containing protein [unclassified Vibrio]|uniref:eCIS core domain-containing protein n=1 Tax=unclassified Vibrio TaxID=2614977 RepID=UPI003075DD30